MTPDDIDWQGRSREMHEAMMDSAPPFVKKTVEDTFMGRVEPQSKTVTEDMMLRQVRETLPDPFRGTLLKRLEQVQAGGT